MIQEFVPNLQQLSSPSAKKFYVLVTATLGQILMYKLMNIYVPHPNETDNLQAVGVLQAGLP